MDNAEQVSTLFVFVVLRSEKGFQLDAQNFGKEQQGVHARGIGAGFEAADGLGVKPGPFAKFSLSKPGDLAVALDGRTQT
ncbi:hypothetical protein D3C76_1544290 [compost metagenome]